MLYYFLMSVGDFKAWGTKLKDRYPRAAFALDSSEYILTRYQGPIALTNAEVTEIENAGGVLMDRPTAKTHILASPDKWVNPTVASLE